MGALGTLNKHAQTKILWVMRDDGEMTEPMNIMLLSALSKENAPERTSYLGLLERDDITSMVRDIMPDIVAGSAITGSQTVYIETFRNLKREFGRKIFTILGGPYCTTYPGVVQDESCLDAIGVFECENAWVEFLNAFERCIDDIHEIPNIITKENCESRLIRCGTSTEISTSHYRDRYSDLDSLPYLDRELIYENTAFKNRFKRTHMAGRGCPFRCAYCFERDWNKAYRGKGKMLQRYSPVRLSRELAHVAKNYDTRFWKFYDDVFPTFPADIDWLREFAEVYPQIVGLPFHCLTRCDLVYRQPEVIELLKKAGIASLTMSVESGNAFIRDYIITRDMTEEQMRFSFELAHKFKIRTFANTILGIPGPTLPKEDSSQFYDHLSDITLDAGNTHLLGKRGKKKIETSIEEIRSRTDNEQVFRRGVLTYLRSLGVRAQQLDYDQESCKFNIELGVSFGEFPILHPYPRTATTRWLISKNLFDGNYHKLHASYQNRSPLPCFTDNEKTIQQNLALLTTFCMLFSGSENRFVKWFSPLLGWICLSVLSRISFHWATAIYEQLYTFSKAYMHETRVYPMEKTIREKIWFYIQMWKLDIWKQFGHRKGLYRNVRPGQTLGGPPSV
jgi:radical SAM superfamily enzyme YgiQ (UPF0313 family)